MDLLILFILLSLKIYFLDNNVTINHSALEKYLNSKIVSPTLINFLKGKNNNS